MNTINPPTPFKARVLSSYEPVETKEIPLLTGTVVNVLRTHESGWWKGEWSGKTGWFPSSHVSYIPPGTSAAPCLPTPPVRRAPKASPTIARIATALNKFFNRRPQKEVLEGRGLLATDKTRVFGRTLAEITDRDHDACGFPTILDRSLEFMWGNALEIEGIFRISPMRGDLDAAMAQIDLDSSTVTFREGSYKDALLASGIVKAFIRQHPEPIFPSCLYDTLLRVGTMADPVEGRVALAIEALNDPAMPQANKLFLGRLFGFMHEALKYEAINKMNPNAYSVVFGVVLITLDVSTSGTNLADISQQAGCISTYISYWDQIAPLVDLDIRGCSVRPVQHTSNGSYGAAAAAVASPAPAAAAAAVSAPSAAPSMCRGDSVRALFNYEANDSKKLALTCDEVLIVERPPENGWVKLRRTGFEPKSGWAPASYVTLI